MSSANPSGPGPRRGEVDPGDEVLVDHVPVRLGVVGGQPDVFVEGETGCLGERDGAGCAPGGQLVVDRQRRRPGGQPQHRIGSADGGPIASAARLPIASLSGRITISIGIPSRYRDCLSETRTVAPPEHGRRQRRTQ